jgi:hypothetical protein
VSKRSGNQNQSSSASAVQQSAQKSLTTEPLLKPRSILRRGSVAGWIHVVALVALVFLVWGLANHRLAPKSWSAPLGYNGDSTFVLGCIKAASEFEYLPFLSRSISRLGAPYAANWNDFPMFEVFPIAFMGMVARWSNLITAWNIGILLSHLTSALAFYGSCRLLRFRREWSAAGALLWAFSFYHNTRCAGQLPVCFDYTVPLGIVCCWLITAGERTHVGDRIFWLCMGCALLLGIGNPYNLSMWLQFLFLGLGFRLLVHRRKSDLAVGAVLLAVAALGFLAVNANNIYYRLAHGENQAAVMRGYKQLEIYALKPIELVLPPWQHRLAFLGDPARWYSMDAWVKGEMFSPYLGIVGLCALVWLAVDFGLRAANLRKVPRRLPTHAPLCLWVLLYSAIGGVNCLVGLVFGLAYFRGSNRYSIFILAIALFFLVSRMSRIVRGWNRAASYGLAVFVTTVGLLDQLPARSEEESLALAKQVQNDQRFGQVLEEKLPPGAMVYQLPLMNFVEADPIRDCVPYDHLRPYLWTKHLRFSFGSVQGRPRDDWQQDVAAVPLEQGVKELERYGFSGLYINRKAYADHAEARLKALADCGRSQIIEDEAREQVCVLLNPSLHPAWPHSDDAALVVYPSGWKLGLFTVGNFGKQSGYWASQSKLALHFINDRPQSCEFRITGFAIAPSPQKLELHFQGKTVWSQPVVPGDAMPVEAHLVAQPGRNYLDFTSDHKPEPRPDQPQAIRVTGGLVGLRIIKDPPSSP